MLTLFTATSEIAVAAGTLYFSGVLRREVQIVTNTEFVGLILGAKLKSRVRV